MATDDNHAVLTEANYKCVHREKGRAVFYKKRVSYYLTMTQRDCNRLII